MRLGWTTSKYTTSYRAVKTIRVNGKNQTLIVKRFGSEKHICETYQVTDAKAWAAQQVRLLNEQEHAESPSYQIELSSVADLALGVQSCYNGGYLFLQAIYHELGLDRICAAMKARRHFEYNLNAILSRLIYTRMLYPGSKLSAYADAQRFIEQPDFQLQHVYRSLSILAAESEYIQSSLFKNSAKVGKRRADIIYYDCTNYYFEIERAEDDKQYGISKENRPLPIVEMGLFMDSEGIPLAFRIHPGNENEQSTMVPLEKVLQERFELSKFVVCTDAGLSSGANRLYNNYDQEDGSRTFITTQSLKKLKKFLREWALEPTGWSEYGDDSQKHNITTLDSEADADKVFYKSRWIKEKVEKVVNGKVQHVELEQQLIVSFSLKYKAYQHTIRSGQVERAHRALDAGKEAVARKRQNDPKRYIKAVHATLEGEAADEVAYTIDEDKILCEEMYDGFYAVCTNLSDTPQEIVAVNKRRWEIEECFRIMKSEFCARPIYVQRQERIVGHFITCFLSLIVYRYLEKKLGNKYTGSQIIDEMREMNFIRHDGKGYQPTYTRSDLTDALHEAFGFCTSKQIVPVRVMKNICARTKIPSNGTCNA